eukprot:GILK01001846.1.p1 GENE.GILK01001846.1~~GILK01001846.1.p1  ORF type:complete len:528 (-),score=117.44 GILK01001846.1:206-1747(-)
MAAPRLVLHFDINKTLLMQDPAGNKTLDGMIDSIIASQAWGKVEDGEWMIQSDQLSTAAPDPEVPLITYSTYVDQKLPLITEEEEADPELRREQNRAIKAQRGELITSFTQKKRPGESLKPYFRKLMAALDLPKLVQKALVNAAAKRESGEAPTPRSPDMADLATEEEKIASLLTAGKHYIVPSFFQLIQHLSNKQRNFAIIFRTFGTDLENIATEYNGFCNGIHPCFNGKNSTKPLRFDGLRKTRDLRLHSNSFGVVHRESADPADILLVMGTLERAKTIEHAQQRFQEAVENGDMTMHRGYADIYLHMNELLKQHSALAFSDDYEWWNGHGETAEAGKLFVVDMADDTVHHIFFDDNINQADSGIVDVRDCVSGDCIPFNDVINKMLVRVDPVRAICDPTYFIQELENCERNRLQQLRDSEEPESVESESEPLTYRSKHSFEPAVEVFPIAKRLTLEELNQLPTREYLEHALFPVLHPALELVELERPLHPIAFLAQHLFKHKNDIHLITN